MPSQTLIWSAIHGLLSVALGAFAAHGLKERLDAQALGWIETGARYQMFGALSLLGLALLIERKPRPEFNRAAACMAWGAAVFSASLYIMALTGARWLGAVTPLGGLLMIFAWFSLGLGAFKERSR